MLENRTVCNGRPEDAERVRRISLASSFTALYIVANTLPISAFIGGAGFITAGIIILPVVARLLRPEEAAIVAVAAPLGLFALQLSVTPIFGFYGLLIPATGIFFGSLGAHKSPLIPAAWIAFGALWFALFSGGTLVWIAPHVLSLILIVSSRVKRFERGKSMDVVTHSLTATMCELSTMTIGSVSILRLPGELWTVITPLMFFERALATAGSSIILLSLMKAKGRLRMMHI